MRKNRACDPCAARKSKCDRESPCRRCTKLSIPCVTVRKLSKSGPKGPWARKKHDARAADDRTIDRNEDRRNVDEPTLNVAAPEHPLPLAALIPSRFPTSLFRRYLDLYQQALYPVWPVVRKDELLLRLNDENDVEAYALAAAVSAVTMAQLYPAPEDGSGLPVIDCLAMALESERARQVMDYQESPSISVLLSSFFLHIASANRGQIYKATLLLREAITFAQIIGIDKGANFRNLCKREAQLQLRIVWLLYITERGHTTRFELPRMLRLDPSLPELEVDENPAVLFAFAGMYNLFRHFGLAMDEVEQGRSQEFYVAMHKRLQETREFPQHSSDLQRADLLITQQWMRIVLWKVSMFHIELMASPADESLSLSLPDQIGKTVAQYLNAFPMHIVEAHGLGMEMKLFEVAISLADVLLCQVSVPADHQLMEVGSRDILTQLVLYLTSFRGGDNVKMQLLQQKMYDTASRISPIPDHPEIDKELVALNEERY